MIYYFSFGRNMENMFAIFLFELLGKFENFTRILLTVFEYLLSKVSLMIEKQDTQLIDSVPAKTRLDSR